MNIATQLEDAVEIAYTGTRRAYLFLGLGVNTAQQPGYLDYHLPGRLNFRLLPEKVDDSQMTEFKDTFGQWIVGNGLRELIEAFEVFLDKIYKIFMQVETWECSKKSEKAYDGKAQKKKLETFERAKGGIPQKLGLLRTECGINTEFDDDIDSIKRARNCLTHCLGISCIRHAQDKETGTLTVKWHTQETYGYNADGSEFIPAIDTYPVQFPTGSPIKIRFPQRQRVFTEGEIIRFEPYELQEICFSFKWAIKQVHIGASKSLRDKGIEMPDVEPLLITFEVFEMDNQ